MNTKYSGMYLFGGTNNQADPVSLDSNGNAVVTSGDISGEVKAQVSSASSIAINIPGSNITDTKIFTSINN